MRQAGLGTALWLEDDMTKEKEKEKEQPSEKKERAPRRPGERRRDNAGSR
jgi:hypothetical protein